jgi:hypothetical protein
MAHPTVSPTMHPGPKPAVIAGAGLVFGGRLAHGLKDLIEWKYRQSIQHGHGWRPV